MSVEIWQVWDEVESNEGRYDLLGSFFDKDNAEAYAEARRSEVEKRYQEDIVVRSATVHQDVPQRVSYYTKYSNIATFEYACSNGYKGAPGDNVRLQTITIDNDEIKRQAIQEAEVMPCEFTDTVSVRGTDKDAVIRLFAEKFAELVHKYSA